MGEWEKTRFPGVLRHRAEKGKYLVRWERRDLKTGKMRDRRKRVTAKSAEEANRRRTEAMDGDGATAAPRRTLGDFAVSWLAGKMPNLSPTTRATYAQQLEHVTSFVFRDGRCFGDYYLDAIEHDDFIAYRDQSFEREGVRGETVNGRLRVAKTMMGDAVATLGLPRDPTLRVKPLPKGPPRRKRGMEPAELRALLEWMRDHERNPQWYPLTLTLGVTAMRWSEATGLEWPMLDYRGQVITIRQRNLRGVLRPGTKSGDGTFRTVPLPPYLADVLKKHRRRIASSPTLAKSGLVFPDELGGPYKGGSGALHKPLARAAKGAGLGRVVSAHDFRHSWNNVLRQVADDEVQQAITGHSTDEMRMHYSHVGAEEKMEAVTRGLRLVMGG